MKLITPPLMEDQPMYVEGVTNTFHLDDTDEGKFALGMNMDATQDNVNPPSAGTQNGILASTAVVDEQVIDFDGVEVEVDPGFGRTVRFISTVAGAGKLIGKNYLNEIIEEDIALTTGNKETTKAFKKLISFTSTGVAGNVQLGRGTKFGLPYVGSQVVQEFVDGVPAGTNGTLTVADTDPVDATTGDPRGLYTPNATLDGSKVVVVQMRFNPDSPKGLFGRGVREVVDEL